eukprot:6190183-Pleurochrysis_carterae.AAC.1
MREGEERPRIRHTRDTYPPPVALALHESIAARSSSFCSCWHRCTSWKPFSALIAASCRAVRRNTRRDAGNGKRALKPDT